MALGANDISKAMMAIADDFENDQGLDKSGQTEFLQGAADQGVLEDMEIDNTSRQITISGDTATVGPTVVEGSFGTITFEFKLEKRDGRWLIVYSSQS